MDWYNFFSGFLRPPDHHTHRRDENDYDDRSPRHENRESFGFNVYTDPMEMSRYFEVQMEQMMSAFRMMDSAFGSFEEIFDFHEIPESGGVPQIPDERPRSLRDQLLKAPDTSLHPRLVPPDSKKGKIDDDLDDKVHSGELDNILEDDVPSTRDLQKRPGLFPSIRIFSNNVTVNTITQKPDGTIEEIYTRSDSKGNVETVKTLRKDDKMYTVTTRKDASGSEEITENAINLDEGEIPEFQKKLEGRVRDIPSESGAVQPVIPKDDNEFWKMMKNMLKLD